MAMTPTATSVAPTTPAEAAKMVQTRITARTRPPRMGPRIKWRASKSPSATPEASSIWAMKMKSGTATSTKSFITRQEVVAKSPREAGSACPATRVLKTNWKTTPTPPRTKPRG